MYSSESSFGSGFLSDSDMVMVCVYKMELSRV
jgi:hypothetical protein